MDISKQQLVEFAQWMDDAARTIEKWAQHAPDYFKRKGRLLPDICRFDDRAQEIRNLLVQAKGIDTPAQVQEASSTPALANLGLTVSALDASAIRPMTSAEFAAILDARDAAERGADLSQPPGPHLLSNDQQAPALK